MSMLRDTPQKQRRLWESLLRGSLLQDIRNLSRASVALW